jgi:hypothetical protein
MAKLDALIFIDTNILLDFYRVRGWEPKLSMLDHIASNHDRLITTSQIEMEYKKNRQRVILEALGKMKTPDWNALSIPAFLVESKHSKAIERGKKEIDAQTKRVRSRIEAVFRDPSRYDRVFRVAQALFRSKTAVNLSRTNAARSTIRRLAWKRFILGYPPRKDGDTSTGDAINWEWIIRCCADAQKDVILVSRDSDYGHTYEKIPVLNDWLRQEFRERVGTRRRIILTNRLAEAFNLISVPVTPGEAAQEENLLAQSEPPPQSSRLLEVMRKTLLPDEFRFITVLLGLSGGREMSVTEAAQQLDVPQATAAELTKSALVKLKAFAKTTPPVPAA